LFGLLRARQGIVESRGLWKAGGRMSGGRIP
jgi:hypothetical protein